MNKENFIEWRKVENTTDILVSNFGDVKSEGGFIFKTFKSKNGYVHVNLSFEGKTKQVQVHRLVAKAFIPNPENKSVVNHKNGDTSNNCVWNLEWCTERENQMHKYFVLGYDTAGNKNPMFGKTGKDNPKYVGNVLVFKDDELIGTYPTQMAACLALGWSKEKASQISRCMNHSRNARGVKGYQFMYEDEYENLKRVDLKPRELLEHPELWVIHYWGQSATKPKR